MKSFVKKSQKATNCIAVMVNKLLQINRDIEAQAELNREVIFELQTQNQELSIQKTANLSIATKLSDILDDTYLNNQ